MPSYSYHSSIAQPAASGMFIDVLLQGCLMQIDLSLQDSELGHILANTVPDVLQLVVKLHIREFLHVPWAVHQRDPVVPPPRPECPRVVESEYLHMLSGCEVVGQDTSVASGVRRSDHPYVGWIHAGKRRDKLFRPLLTGQDRVVIDAVEVVRSSLVRSQDGIVLSPCRIATVLHSDEMGVNVTPRPSCFLDGLKHEIRRAG
mmetsp:Transcript_7036/g.18186  ORF Transcript_7036/g.18186 Transcript_7036/m.18186 type:complete len:202 (+) Transcript_7036:86-691(+)